MIKAFVFLLCRYGYKLLSSVVFHFKEEGDVVSQTLELVGGK
jgi:hypothetical protein